MHVDILSTTAIIDMLYMILNDKYYNFVDMKLFKIAAKLGYINGRSNNIYFNKFLMILANHVTTSLVISNANNKYDCWV